MAKWFASLDFRPTQHPHPLVTISNISTLCVTCRRRFPIPRCGCKRDAQKAQRHRPEHTCNHQAAATLPPGGRASTPHQAKQWRPRATGERRAAAHDCNQMGDVRRGRISPAPLFNKPRSNRETPGVFVSDVERNGRETGRGVEGVEGSRGASTPRRPPPEGSRGPRPLHPRRVEGSRGRGVGTFGVR